MSTNPVINSFLSLSSIFMIIAILIGPIPNLLTNYDKHQDLCDKRKALFATLMYWALGFLAVYLFLSGQVFSTLFNISYLPGRAANDVLQSVKFAQIVATNTITETGKEIVKSVNNLNKT
jgi:Na+/melibiose symporter-like transporter